ncbi:MAG: peptide deformylase [Oscillospiraceae bacterium]
MTTGCRPAGRHGRHADGRRRRRPGRAQVGILRRAVVVDTGEEFLEMVNPEIIETSGEQSGMEGCLSVPGVYGFVKRPMVTVRAQDRDGKWFEVNGEELTARCFCHECDHLDGHLYREKVYRYPTQEELEELYGDGEDGSRMSIVFHGHAGHCRRVLQGCGGRL